MEAPFAFTPNLIPTEPRPVIERAPLMTGREVRPRYVGDERNAGGLGVGETIDDYYRASIGDSSVLTPPPAADGTPAAGSSGGGCCG